LKQTIFDPLTPLWEGRWSVELPIITLKCAQCGFSHPGAIDFHHTDSATKEGEVSRLAGVGSYKKAYAEIEKCIPLCSNCHRILHWDEHRA
jgi:predicted HNH restriction endonuclease